MSGYSAQAHNNNVVVTPPPLCIKYEYLLHKLKTVHFESSSIQHHLAAKKPAMQQQQPCRSSLLTCNHPAQQERSATELFRFPRIQQQRERSVKKSVRFSEMSTMMHVRVPSAREVSVRWYTKEQEEHFQRVMYLEATRQSKVYIAPQRIRILKQSCQVRSWSSVWVWYIFSRKMYGIVIESTSSIDWIMPTLFCESRSANVRLVRIARGCWRKWRKRAPRRRKKEHSR